MGNNMIEALETRRLFHFVFVQNGVLNFPGANELNDTLTITIVGSNYRATANDGFSKDTPISEVTAGININGGSGNDHIIIGAGITIPTTLIGGDGNDTIEGGAGKDNIFGDLGIPNQSGNDVLLGNGGRDILFGGAGDDTLSGGTKNDTLIGEGGADSLVGSAGTLDTVSYVSSTAAVNVSLDGIANDGAAGEKDNITETCEVFIGGSGDDFIRGSGKPNILSGSKGNDTLIGGSGNDTLFGGDGRDSLEGQAGNDSLVSSGDDAIDTLVGGSGTDKADKDKIDLASSIP
jgi:Ca2+-binding RTX toxin-like protein